MSVRKVAEEPFLVSSGQKALCERCSHSTPLSCLFVCAAYGLLTWDQVEICYRRRGGSTADIPNRNLCRDNISRCFMALKMLLSQDSLEEISRPCWWTNLAGVIGKGALPAQVLCTTTRLIFMMKLALPCFI